MSYSTAWNLPEERIGGWFFFANDPLIHLNSVKGKMDHIRETETFI